MQLLTGKTAMITGGTSGIGLAIARRFALEGAQVIVSGRRGDVVEVATGEIGAGAVGLTGDVAEPAFHDRAAREIAERFGGLDIYVANAGIATAHEDGRQIVPDIHARYFGAELAERSLLPGPDARLARLRFDDWLRESLRPARIAMRAD